MQLPLLMFAYRTSTHETTGSTPFELMYSQEAQLPEDLMFHIPGGVDIHFTPEEYLSHLKTRLETAYNLVKVQTNTQVCQRVAYKFVSSVTPFTKIIKLIQLSSSAFAVPTWI